MTSTQTITEASTFTITHARYLASKIATDLKRMQRMYGRPTEKEISNYEAEAIAFFKAGYLATVTYGFKRNGEWIEPTLRYVAAELSGLATTDDDPGRVRPGADISDASFGSYLTYTLAWSNLTASDKESFEKALPLQRTGANEPTINGYLSQDKTYSAGGQSVSRSTVRSL